MKRYTQRKTGLGSVKIIGLGLALFLCSMSVFAQQVKTSIDRDTIKIGEKITYQVEVNADTSARVVFPQGQAFIPLQVFDTSAVDTFYTQQKYTLKKTYALTQFDSGAYTVPKQTIIINGKGYYTDTFNVKVNGVVVDTTKQKLYPIKPALNVKMPFSIPEWIWWVLAVLIAGFLVYLLLRIRKKIEEKKKELPPYEKAIQRLKQLDENQDLESGRVKAYYSTLSEAIKRYVDEKIDDRALESTTDEFIALLKIYKQQKEITLDEQVIDNLEEILKRADLAKFAGIKTDKLTAREDRQAVENDINAFNEAIPEPTEEEKLLDEAYKLEQERKKKRKKLWVRVGIAGIAVLIVIGAFITIKGFTYTKALVFSTPTAKLLKDDWITSEYGVLGATVTTPKVLMRQMDTVPKLFPTKTEVEERFSYGNIEDNLYIQVTNVRFKKNAKMDTLIVGKLLDKELNDKAVTNLTFKHQDFSTLQNDKGQKVFGTFALKDAAGEIEGRKAYTFLVFNQRGGVQEILVTYNVDDKAGEDIEERVVNSVQFNKKHDD